MGLSDVCGLSVLEFWQIVNDYEGIDFNSVLSSGFVDVIDYWDVVLNCLCDCFGLEEDEDIKWVSLSVYVKVSKVDKDYFVKDKIVIIYVEGVIVDGNGMLGIIGDEQYVKYIKEACKSDCIKVVVFWVNLLGGSVMVFENIWKEICLMQEVGKLVVVFMGDYVVFGGYYIFVVADLIFVEFNILIGFIGVFFLILDVSDLMNEKFGIYFDMVKIGDFFFGIILFFLMFLQGVCLM